MVEMEMEKRIQQQDGYWSGWRDCQMWHACCAPPHPCPIPRQCMKRKFKHSIFTYLQYSALRVAASVGENGMKLSEATG